MRTLYLASLSIFLSIMPAGAQWGSFRVTNDPANSQTEIDGGRNVTFSDGILGVVWSDDRDGNDEVYYRERDQGTWNSEVRLTLDSARSVHPAVGRSQGEMRVVWQDDRSGHAEIWTKRKILGAWTADSCLTCDAFESTRPSLDHKGEHLVWEETKDGNREIYYRNRLTSGTWEPEVRLSNDPAESSHPTIASPHRSESYPPLLLALWQDDRNGHWDIYSRFLDHQGWHAETRVTSDPGDSRFPSAEAEWDTCSDAIGPLNRAVWQDDRDGNEEIYLSRGIGFWQTPVRVTNTPTPSRHPSLTSAFYLLGGPFGLGFCPYPGITWEEKNAVGTGGAIKYLAHGSSDPIATVSHLGARPRQPSIAADHVFTDTGTRGSSVLTRTIEVVWTDSPAATPEIFEASDVTMHQVTSAPVPPPGVGDLQLGLLRPNPFSGRTDIPITLAREGAVEVRVVDAAGRIVRDLFHGSMPAGSRTIVWDGLEQTGRAVASGTYFVVVRTPTEQRIRRAVLTR